jgi:hypothetical protein
VEFEEQVDNILREAYDNIIQEGLKQELDDFKKVEDFLASKGLIDDSSSEIWYISLNGDPDMDLVNPEAAFDDDAQALAIKYKGTYGDLYVALQDSEMIHECKADKCVGIITRSEAWASETAQKLGKRAADCDDKVTMHITTLTTPRGVHVIIRNGDQVDCATYPKSKIKTGENQLIDALVNACFHW